MASRDENLHPLNIAKDDIKRLESEFPELYRTFRESEAERLSYKKAELSFRKYEEKRIVKNILKRVPDDIQMDVSLLFKAKSFLSGDFVYATKYVDEKFLIWLGDSISHGTGSKIVKDVIRDTILQVFTLFKSNKDYSLSKLVHRVQREFSSPRVVKQIMESDLSDIIPSNDPSAKLSIVIPIVFLQVERELENYRVRFCNRGMPLVLIVRRNPEDNSISRIFCFTRKNVYEYEGKYLKDVETRNLSGFPLVLDRQVLSYFMDTDPKVITKYLMNSKSREKYFNIEEFVAQPGDTVVIPSDGVLDVINYHGEEFGINRFIDTLYEYMSDPVLSNAPINVFKEEYYWENVRKFAVWNEDFPISGQGIDDDLTLLFLRFK